MPSRNRIRAAHGFTLIETMVSCAILSVFMATLFMGLSASMRSVDAEHLDTSTYSKTGGSMAKMTRWLMAARYVSVSVDGSSITFQIPVDPNGDGGFMDELDADGDSDLTEILWGRGDGTPTRPYISGAAQTMTLRFVPETSGRIERENTGVAKQTRRFNQDGDSIDSFRMGTIELTDSAGRHYAWFGGDDERGFIAVNAAATNGDVDGDGANDPIFQINFDGMGDASDVVITLHALEVKSTRMNSFVRSQTRVYLRNPQN